MVSSVAVQKRVESEGSFGALAGGGRRIGTKARIEHARFARLFGRGIWLRGRDRLLLLRRRRRGQIERSLASAAAERKRGNAQKHKGPSLILRAAVRSHVKIPNAAAPYKD